MLATLSLLVAGFSLGELVFEKQKIADTRFEAASVFDVNKDGKMDIVSGELWHAGPDFTQSHKMCDVMPSGDYFDDFSDFPMDVNGDGYLDVVTGAWFGEKMEWRENPQGGTGLWALHEIAKVGNVERPMFCDIDGDGKLDIAPNTPGRPQRIFRHVPGEARFEMHTISEVPTGHGLGFGDLNGDGRGDLIVWNGWFEAPAKPFSQEWTWHNEPKLYDSASVPILVHDVNKDGRNDIIVGAGHHYGLAWWEQGPPSGGAPKDGVLTFKLHEIEPKRSQFHDMQLADIDNDGEMELITGKRWRAHPEGDPGVNDPVGLYYYELEKGEFERHTLDYGPGETAAGTGIYCWVGDVDGDGWKDIVAPGKGGLYLFWNKGPRK